MGNLIRYNKQYLYIDSYNLYDWNHLYSDHTCKNSTGRVYGTDNLKQNPPILNKEEAIKLFVKANLSNELKYILWELEEAFKSGEDHIKILLDNPLSEKSRKCLEILGYSVVDNKCNENLKEREYKIGITQN